MSEANFEKQGWKYKYKGADFSGRDAWKVYGNKAGTREVRIHGIYRDEPGRVSGGWNIKDGGNWLSERPTRR